MAQVLASTRIQARPERVLALIADQGQRARFLPDGWRVAGFLTEAHDRIGSMMEVEAAIGPGKTVNTLQLQLISNDSPPGSGQTQVIESPPGADNYVTTWTLMPEASGTVLYIHTEFSYGGILGEFLVRRQLRAAYAQMLDRLKALAERGPEAEGA